MAGLVWDSFLADMAGNGKETKKIWDRQVSNFWDMAWVIGNSDAPAEDGKWLDQRKNWRTYWPSTEEGDHCVLMHDWQELSGYVRSREQKSQEQFWEKLRKNIAKKRYYNTKMGTLELSTSERLCAIALIKRLFPVLFKIEATKQTAKDIIGFIPSGDGLGKNEAEEAVIKWRSTSHMAASSWLRRISQDHPKILSDLC